jgi:hypothetical protein
MADDLAFIEVLRKRNIDAAALLARQPDVYHRWRAIYGSTHPEAFLGLIRNEINRVRRQVQHLPVQRES